MQNRQFKGPLIKTAGIIAAVILLIACMGLSEGGSGAASIAQFILFVVGLAISLPVTIGVMIGIFFGAVAMADKDTARQLWGDLKTRYSM